MLFCKIAPSHLEYLVYSLKILIYIEILLPLERSHIVIWAALLRGKMQNIIQCELEKIEHFEKTVFTP